MNKKILIVGIFVLLVGSFGFLNYETTQENEMVCDDIKVYDIDFIGPLDRCSRYVTEDEPHDFKYFKLNSELHQNE